MKYLKLSDKENEVVELTVVNNSNFKRIVAVIANPEIKVVAGRTIVEFEAIDITPQLPD